MRGLSIVTELKKFNGFNEKTKNPEDFRSDKCNWSNKLTDFCVKFESVQPVGFMMHRKANRKNESCTYFTYKR